MKSIMEQASSIVKAIEKAWISANKPKEFSVKIFEQEEKNFFGMTTKPAKIGIFFSEKSTSTDKYPAKNKPEATEKSEPATKRPEHHHQQQQHVKQKPEAKRPQQPEKVKSNVSPAPKQQNLQTAPKQPKPARIEASWSNTVSQAATDWIKQTLVLMGIDSAIVITPETMGKVLKLTFSQPVLENPLAEKNLFRSIAHLVMASLRNQYKQEIKDLKIVLLRQQ